MLTLFWSAIWDFLLVFLLLMPFWCYWHVHIIGNPIGWVTQKTVASQAALRLSPKKAPVLSTTGSLAKLTSALKDRIMLKEQEANGQTQLRGWQSFQQRNSYERDWMYARRSYSLGGAILAMIGTVIAVGDRILWEVSGVTSPTLANVVLRSCVTLSTVFLCVLITRYYKILLAELRVKGLVRDSDSLMSSHLRGKYLVELFLCAIHVGPWFNWTDSQWDQILGDVALAMMTLRLYLLVRMMQDRSTLTTQGARLIGALTHVKFTPGFIIKAYIDANPIRGFVLVSGVLAITIAFLVNLVESYDSTSKVTGFWDSFWLVIITLTSVGFGEVVPTTIWGRVIIMVGAFLGILMSALMIAVINTHLQLSTTQTRVLHFLHRDGMKKSLRSKAASLIQAAWRVYKTRNTPGVSVRTVRQAERSYLKEIRRWKLIKKTVASRSKDVGLSPMVENILIAHDIMDQNLVQVQKTIDQFRREMSRGPPTTRVAAAAAAGAGVKRGGPQIFPVIGGATKRRTSVAQVAQRAHPLRRINSDLSQYSSISELLTDIDPPVDPAVQRVSGAEARKMSMTTNPGSREDIELPKEWVAMPNLVPSSRRFETTSSLKGLGFTADSHDPGPYAPRELPEDANVAHYNNQDFIVRTLDAIIENNNAAFRSIGSKQATLEKDMTELKADLSHITVLLTKLAEK